MNTSSATHRLMDAKPSGASFLDVLANMSVQQGTLSKGTGSSSTGSQSTGNADTKTNSDTTSADGATSKANSTSNGATTPGGSDGSKALLTSAGQKALVSQASSSQGNTRTNTGTVGRLAGQQEKAQGVSGTSARNVDQNAAPIATPTVVISDQLTTVPVIPTQLQTSDMSSSSDAGTGTGTQQLASVDGAGSTPAAATSNNAAISALVQSATLEPATTTDANGITGSAKGASDASAHLTTQLPKAAPSLTTATTGAAATVEAKGETQKVETIKNASTMPVVESGGDHATTAANTNKAETRGAESGSKSSATVSDTSADGAVQPVGTASATDGSSQAVAEASQVIVPVPIVPTGETSAKAVSVEDGGNGSKQSGSAIQSSSFAASISQKSSDGSNTVSAAKSSQSESSSSSNSSTSGNQSVQGSQADANQVTAIGSKAATTDPTQVSVIATQSAGHDAPVSHDRVASSGDTVHSSDHLAQADQADNTSTSGINTASVIQRMSESEMRVGMHSAEFGDISIRTSVSQQQMTAQISVDHGELGRALSAHIPAMEAKLGGDLGVHATVEVSQSGMSFSGEREQASAKEQKTYAPLAQNENAAGSVETEYTSVRVAATTSDGYRLDIRA